MGVLTVVVILVVMAFQRTGDHHRLHVHDAPDATDLVGEMLDVPHRSGDYQHLQALLQVEMDVDRG